ncbi:ALG3 protein-domain-containing protein [Lactifluus volemus]|nr:ALG3 protein-domain-containing protein [Lactifluus volemus]
MRFELNAVRGENKDRLWKWVSAGDSMSSPCAIPLLLLKFNSVTEIDWETYMHQVKIYLDGERDYSSISGPTGPLVYPAGHVYIHALLYWLTDAGRNLALLQQIYAFLYTVSLILSCAIYRRAVALHSIFVLRLFNDVWAVTLTQLSILALVGVYLILPYYNVLQCCLIRQDVVLLYLPAFLVVLVKQRGLATTIRLCVVIFSVQALLAYPFLHEHPLPYLKHAYDFGRIFLYKWTGVTCGTCLRSYCVWTFRWCRAAGGPITILNRAVRYPSYPGSPVPVTADETITIALTSNLIGILFARSLHYQFYSWYAYQVPLLAWRTTTQPFSRAIEYAWNVYPSTTISSVVLCVSHVVLLGGIWFGYADGKSHVFMKKCPP